MKKIIALLLVAVMCLALVSCENELFNKNSDDIFDPNLDSISKFGDKIEKGSDLTLENWSDYLQIKSYNAEINVVENGEDIKKIETQSAIIASLDKIHTIHNFAMVLKHKESGETKIIDYSDENNGDIIYVEEGFSFDDYDCLDIQGTIYYYNFLNTIVAAALEDNKSGNHTCYCSVIGGETKTFTLQVNVDLKYVIDKNPNTTLGNLG